ncbi:hypothetical protein ACFE04_003508 [Oxalis oulophora]
MLASNSDITRRSLNGQIKPTFEFFVELFGSVNDVVKASKRCPWLFHPDLENVLKPNVDMFVNEGVCMRNLGSSVLSNPRIIFQKLADIVCGFNAVKKLGIDPKDPQFCTALRVLIQTSESILMKKMEVYKSLGWSEEEIMCMFRRNPNYLAYSEEKIRTGMDFFVNTVEVEREFVVAHPNLLTYSMDKMRRRYKYSEGSGVEETVQMG